MDVSELLAESSTDSYLLNGDPRKRPWSTSPRSQPSPGTENRAGYDPRVVIAPRDPSVGPSKRPGTGLASDSSFLLTDAFAYPTAFKRSGLIQHTGQAATIQPVTYSSSLEKCRGPGAPPSLPTVEVRTNEVTRTTPLVPRGSSKSQPAATGDLVTALEAELAEIELRYIMAGPDGLHSGSSSISGDSSGGPADVSSKPAALAPLPTPNLKPWAPALNSRVIPASSSPPTTTVNQVLSTAGTWKEQDQSAKSPKATDTPVHRQPEGAAASGTVEGGGSPAAFPFMAGTVLRGAAVSVGRRTNQLQWSVASFARSLGSAVPQAPSTPTVRLGVASGPVARPTTPTAPVVNVFTDSASTVQMATATVPPSAVATALVMNRRDVDDRLDRTPGQHAASAAAAVIHRDLKWASAGPFANGGVREIPSTAETLQPTACTSDLWRSIPVLSEDRWEEAGVTRGQLPVAGSTGGSFLSTLEMMAREEAAGSRAVAGARPEGGTSAVVATCRPLTAPDHVGAEAAPLAGPKAVPAHAGAAAVLPLDISRAATVVPAPAAQHVGAARSLAALFESNARVGGKDRAESSQCGLQGHLVAHEPGLNAGACRAVESQQDCTGLSSGTGEVRPLSHLGSNIIIGEALCMMSPQQLPEPHPQRPPKHHEQSQQPRSVLASEHATASPEHLDDRGQGHSLSVTNAVSIGSGYASLDPVGGSASNSAAANNIRGILGARAASLLQQLRAELNADRPHLAVNPKIDPVVSLDRGGLGCPGDIMQVCAAESPEPQACGSCSTRGTLGEPLPPAETVVASGLQPDVRRSVEGLLADVEGLIADLGAAAGASFTHKQSDVVGLAVEQNGAPRQQLQPLPDPKLTSQLLRSTSEMPHLQQQQHQQGLQALRPSSQQHGVLLQSTQQQGPLHQLPQLPTVQPQQQPPPVPPPLAPRQPQGAQPPLPLLMHPLTGKIERPLQIQQLKSLVHQGRNVQEYSCKDQHCADKLEDQYHPTSVHQRAHMHCGSAAAEEGRRGSFQQEQHLLQPQIFAEQHRQQGAHHQREQRLYSPRLQQEQRVRGARLLVPQRPQSGDWQQERRLPLFPQPEQPQTTEHNQLGMPADKASWLHHPILAGPARFDYSSDERLVQRGGVDERWHGLGPDANEVARRWLERGSHRSLTVHSTVTHNSQSAALPSRLGLNPTGPASVVELEDRADRVDATALALIAEIEQRLAAEEEEKPGEQNKGEKEGKAEKEDKAKEDEKEMERCREVEDVEEKPQGGELVGPPPSFGDDWLLEQLRRCLDRVTQEMDTIATSRALILAEAKLSSWQPLREARQVALQALQDRLVEVTARYNARRQRRHAGRCGGASCASLTCARLGDKTLPDRDSSQEQHSSHSSYRCPSQQLQSPRPPNQELHDATRDGQPSSSLRNILAQLASLGHTVAIGTMGPNAANIATDVTTAATAIERHWENGGDCGQSFSLLNSLNQLVPRDATPVLQSPSAILPKLGVANSRRPEANFSPGKVLASGMLGAFGATNACGSSHAHSIVSPTVSTAVGGSNYSGSCPQPRGQTFNPVSMALLQSATPAVAPLAIMPATAEPATPAAVGPQVRLHRSILERLGAWQQRMHTDNIRPPWDQSLAAAKEFQPRRLGPGCRPGLPLQEPLSATASARRSTAAMSGGTIAPPQLVSCAPDARWPHPTVWLPSPQPARPLSPPAPQACDVYERTRSVTDPCTQAATPRLLTPEAHSPIASPIAASKCALAPNGRWPSVLEAPGASVLMPGNRAEAEEVRALHSLVKSLPRLDALERMQLWERLEHFLAHKLARSPRGGTRGYDHHSLRSGIGQGFPFNGFGVTAAGGIYSRSNSPLRSYVTMWERRQRGSSTGSAGGASFSPWERRLRYRMEDGKHRRQGSDGTDRIARRVTAEQLRQSISLGTRAGACMGTGMQHCGGPAFGGGSLLDTTLEAVHNVIAPNATLAHALTLNWQAVRSQTARMEPGGGGQ
ncbi:hypothetical protein Vafri_4009 [Volvox africanus]|uniref:Uncharacterized protein n=1 Tax=Volvox africanus TaxID=51714 RepID=A0A8J4ETE5_9CHLO|nr:hypothetical protein Vafri_4009 [Volvox africanus]